MLAKVRFRTAAAADSGAVSAVYLAARKRFLPYAPLAHSDEDIRRWMAEVVIPHAQVSVAELDSRVVGMMVLARREEVGWIDHLYLAPEAVGQGIGSAFVAQAKERLGAPVRLYTFQANLNARRFYERHGFRAIKFGDGSQNEEHCPDVLYEWRG